jgi:hypothetical protein
MSRFDFEIKKSKYFKMDWTLQGGSRGLEAGSGGTRGQKKIIRVRHALWTAKIKAKMTQMYFECHPICKAKMCCMLRTSNNFPFMYSQKRFGQTSLLLSTKYFHYRIKAYSLELWYSVVLLYTVDAAIHLSALGTTSFQNGITKLR